VTHGSPSLHLDGSATSVCSWLLRRSNPNALAILSENRVADVPCADRCSVAAAKQYGRTEPRLICCRRDREDRSCHPDREAAQAVAEFRLGHWARAAPLATRGLRLRR